MGSPGVGLIEPLPMLAPAMLTGTAAWPRKPELGVMLVRAGGPIRTVKLEPAEAALAPLRVVTVMLQAPNGPTGLTAKVAVIWVELTTVTLPSEMAPEAQVDTTNEVARKLVPVMVTVGVEPSGAWKGDKEGTVGGTPPAPISHMGPASAAKRLPWPSKARPL